MCHFGPGPFYPLDTDADCGAIGAPRCSECGTILWPHSGECPVCPPADEPEIVPAVVAGDGEIPF